MKYLLTYYTPSRVYWSKVEADSKEEVFDAIQNAVSSKDGEVFFDCEDNTIVRFSAIEAIKIDEIEVD